METPIQIAIITTFATILSVIVNQTINIWIVKKNEKRDKINLITSILNDKKKSLENAKIKLEQIPKIEVDNNLPIMIQASKHVEHEFFYSKGIFNDISHLLKTDRIKEISEIHENIIDKLAEFKLLANKLENKSLSLNQESEILNLYDLAYKAMPGAIKLIKDSVESELFSTMEILRQQYERE